MNYKDFKQTPPQIPKFFAGSRNQIYVEIALRRAIYHALHDPVSMENKTMCGSKHTVDEWRIAGFKLEQRQTPAYCLNCHDYQWNDVPPCNKCRIQTEHDLRTSKLPKAPEHDEEYYDSIIYEERAERIANGKVGSTSIPKWLAVLPNALPFSSPEENTKGV